MNRYKILNTATRCNSTHWLHCKTVVSCKRITHYLRNNTKEQQAEKQINNSDQTLILFKKQKENILMQETTQPLLRIFRLEDTTSPEIMRQLPPPQFWRFLTNPSYSEPQQTQSASLAIVGGITANRMEVN